MFKNLTFNHLKLIKNFKLKIKNYPGFTLMEVLVTVVLLSGLATIGYLLLNPSRLFASSRDTRRKSDLASVQAGLEMYYSENNQYPATGGVPFGGAWTVGGKTYMASVPNDPTAGQSYCYEKVGTTGYLLCTKMETTDMYGTPGSGTTCNATWTYCVKNPY